MSPHLFNLLLAALFVALTASCAHRDADILVPPLDRIQSWEELTASQRKRKLPLKERFQKGDRVLVFIASKHETSPSSETFRLIREEIAGGESQLVILEGLPTRLGLSNPAFLGRAAPRTENAPSWPGEHSYAAFLARQKGIPFLGGEPSRRQLQRDLQKKGFTTSDVIYFFMVANVLSHWRQGGTIMTDQEGYMARALADSRRGFQLKETAKLSVERFRRWYALGNGRAFRLGSVSRRECAPLKTSPLKTNRISHAWEQARNAHLLVLIAKSAEKWKRILVVYGGGHYLELQLALRKMFDKSPK
ncbi:hypothetical protein KKF84_04400 [Myxococcota bacterium]|nr:hypothetical protein [Myxococcota bacterium]MBU1534536.1 hypothetical protein [Myxococcota bacterium]